MGSGAWSARSYHQSVRAKAAAGVDTFDYSAKAQKTGNLSVHPSLQSYGLTMRQSRDSDEHPDSNAILISLDVTGSMTKVLRQIHKDLPHLHELLLGHKYVPHPQIMFAAVGDATCDRVPLQVGQFESDNRMDKNLENMILEGGGGGQKTESYELALYIAARHTSIDCWEKRGRKGYLFIIGDEAAYPYVRRAHVDRLIGIDPQADIPLQQIVAEAQEKFHIYFLIPGGAQHGGDASILHFWQQLLGADHVLKLIDPDETSESIAMMIGLNEGVILLDSAQPHTEERAAGGILSRLLSVIGIRPSGTAENVVTSDHRL